jgi:hypothetical protein
LADSGKEFEVAPGGDDKCPECGMTLAPLQSSEPAAGRGGLGKMVPIGGAALAVLVLAIGGYSGWRNKQVVVLMPEVATVAPSPAMASAPTATVPATPAPAVQDAAASRAEVNVAETAARLTCDEATRAKRPDAEKICSRAAAVTLLNSGAQAAVAGKLDQAERDYAAAKDKDADIPELYFNLAVLKARQGKGTEAVDNLTLAMSKGFRQPELIASEPAFAKLKADLALKTKLDALINKK